MKAYVVPRTGERRRGRRDRLVPDHLARYKCPSKILFVDPLPKNVTGKLLRRSAGVRRRAVAAGSAAARRAAGARHRCAGHQEADEQHADPDREGDGEARSSPRRALRVPLAESTSVPTAMSTLPSGEAAGASLAAPAAPGSAGGRTPQPPGRHHRPADDHQRRPTRRAARMRGSGPNTSEPGAARRRHRAGRGARARPAASPPSASPAAHRSPVRRPASR